jgi:hypothetical protein
MISIKLVGVNDKSFRAVRESGGFNEPIPSLFSKLTAGVKSEQLLGVVSGINFVLVPQAVNRPYELQFWIVLGHVLSC